MSRATAGLAMTMMVVKSEVGLISPGGLFRVAIC